MTSSAEGVSENPKVVFLRDGVKKDLFENILPFWIEHSCEDRNDGFVGKMSNDLREDRGAAKGLILNARILWAFSAAVRLDDQKEYEEMAERSFDYLTEYFEDEEEGGYFMRVQPYGRPLGKNKILFGQASTLYGLSEYFLATNSKKSLKRAQSLFNLIESKCREKKGLGYHETFDREWEPIGKEGLPQGGKTMGTHLHMLEAYANLYRAWPNQRVEEALRALVDLFFEKMVHPEEFYFHETFDPEWRPLKETHLFGHDLEVAWLLCGAANALEDEALISRANALCLNIADQVLAVGVDEDGGVFNMGKNGEILDSKKSWWPQAESLIGFVQAWQISDEERYLDAAVGCWEFIEDQIIDSEHGEWFRSVEDASRPRAEKISEWKGPYHNGRVCMELIKRLNATDL